MRHRLFAARRRALVASVAVALVGTLLGTVPTGPAASAAGNEPSPRLVEQTETADIYANGDGTNTAVFYAGPVNFFDKTAKQWRKIDNQFQRKNDRIENGAGPIQVQLPSEVSASDAITVTKDDTSVSFAFEDAKSKRPAKISNGHVRYDDVGPGISLEYRMLSRGLKEDIVLDQAPSANWPGYYRFRLSAQGLTPVAADGDTAVSLHDAQGHELARIPRGTMVDAGGALGTVDMKLGSDTAGWFVDVVPNSDFIRSSARTYPLRIDPEVEYTWAGSADMSDAFVGNACGSCTWDSWFLRAGWQNGYEYYSYLRFGDMSRIRGKAVTWSQLRMYANSEGDPSRYGWTALLTKQSWSESSITWDNKANHGPELIDIDANLQTWPDYYADTRSWAQAWADGQHGEWINGKWSPYGITINTAGANAWYEFGSSESGDSNTMPQLWVKYNNASPNMPPAGSLSPSDPWTGTSAPELRAGFSDPDDTAGIIEFQIDAGTPVAVGPDINGIYKHTPAVGTGPHSWRARGKDANSTGPWTASRSFTVTSPAPYVPDALSPRDGFIDDEVPILSARFTHPTGENGTLQFEISGVGTFDVPGVANGATGHYLPTIANSTGTYSWRVRARAASGTYSGWSLWRGFGYDPTAEWMMDDFSNTGGAWDTAKWNTSSGLTVSSAQGIFPSATSSKRATASGPLLEDSEVSLTYAFSNRGAGSSLRLTLRGGPGTSSSQLPNGYRIDIPSGSNVITLNSLVNGSVTPLGSFSYAGPLDSNALRLRFRLERDQLYARIWRAGDLEPSSWGIGIPDPNAAVTGAGTLQLAHAYQTSGGRTVAIDDVTYSSNLAPGAIVATQTFTSGSGSTMKFIECKFKVNHPHKSHHVPGTVNVEATGDCKQSDGTRPSMPSITLTVKLFRDDIAIDFEQLTAYNDFEIKVNASDDRCHSGSLYQGWMRFFFRSPPGFLPETGEGEGFGRELAVC